MLVVTYFHATDDRGTFSNLPLHGLPDNFVPKRIYWCKNYQQNMVRAFHYHKNESKIIICTRGAVKIVSMEIEKITGKTESYKFEEHVFTDTCTKAAYLPAPMANGWKSLTPESTILVLSNSTTQESMEDDIRYPAKLYNWEAKWR